MNTHKEGDKPEFPQADELWALVHGELSVDRAESVRTAVCADPDLARKLDEIQRFDHFLSSGLAAAAVDVDELVSEIMRLEQPLPDAARSATRRPWWRQALPIAASLLAVLGGGVLIIGIIGQQLPGIPRSLGPSLGGIDQKAPPQGQDLHWQPVEVIRSELAPSGTPGSEVPDSRLDVQEAEDAWRELAQRIDRAYAGSSHPDRIKWNLKPAVRGVSDGGLEAILRAIPEGNAGATLHFQKNFASVEAFRAGQSVWSEEIVERLADR